MNISIHVEGDAYWACFFIPPGRCAITESHKPSAHAHFLPVGTEYIYRAISAACLPLLPGQTQTPRGVTVTRKSWMRKSNDVPIALYEVENVGAIVDCDEEASRVPLLRLKSAETQTVALQGLTGKKSPAGADKMPDPPDVLVHWFGELAKKKHRSQPGSRSCKIHIQVGLAGPLDMEEPGPASASSATGTRENAALATPSLARIVVVNVGELSAAHRIRRNLSYEAVAVDLLRFLRGANADAIQSPSLEKLLSLPKAVSQSGLDSQSGTIATPQSVLVVRLNNSAIFLYACEASEKEFKEHGAWLLCHSEECAPLSQSELGHMAGYTGFVSSHIAAAVAEHLSSKQRDKRQAAPGKLLDAVMAGAQRSLLWQRANFDRGCLHMLFKKEGNQKAKWIAIPNGSKAIAEDKLIYGDMFADIVQTLAKKYGTSSQKSGDQSFSNGLRQFDEGLKKDILKVRIQINRAVAHRTQWFMARSLADRSADGADSLQDLELGEKFHEMALGWLSEKKPVEPPIVRIGHAELTDRREVEDFLAIQHALHVYARSHDGPPLNIAVFGSPGSGKSYAVRQVVKHLSDAKKGRFQKHPLTFNLSQFKSLDDLPSALHLVRNECLHGEIPIVFFDEFDASFQGQAFGWLKYFLAPMQDGEFYHSGQNYKLGSAVFVFAGGVNRSFEELNGRMRNPGFCEAKGPDFISRLKAHLNVQGINKPEAEADQCRYILRRGIILRGFVKRHLGLQDQSIDKLLHASVASALLRIERFKHGVRSLEAIIKMCSVRPGYPIGPSDLPSMDQLEMHVDAMKLLELVDKYSSKTPA